MRQPEFPATHEYVSTSLPHECYMWACMNSACMISLSLSPATPMLARPCFDRSTKGKQLKDMKLRVHCLLQTKSLNKKTYHDLKKNWEQLSITQRNRSYTEKSGFQNYIYTQLRGPGHTDNQCFQHPWEPRPSEGRWAPPMSRRMLITDVCLHTVRWNRALTEWKHLMLPFWQPGCPFIKSNLIEMKSFFKDIA